MSFVCVVGHWSLSKPSALSLKEAAIKKVLSLRKCAKNILNTFCEELGIFLLQDNWWVGICDQFLVDLDVIICVVFTKLCLIKLDKYIIQ